MNFALSVRADRFWCIGLGIRFLEEEEESNVPSHSNIVLNILLFEGTLDVMAVCSQCLDICNFLFTPKVSIVQLNILPAAKEVAKKSMKIVRLEVRAPKFPPSSEAVSTVGTFD